MAHDPEKLYEYLEQTKDLYGNTLYRENPTVENNTLVTGELGAYYQEICDCQLCDLGKSRPRFVLEILMLTLYLLVKHPVRKKSSPGNPS